MSSVAFYIFFPAYFFIELLPSVSPSIFRNWWPLLFAPAFAVSLGIAFGHLICLILRLPRDVRGIVLAATSLANMTAMVPVLVQSLAEDSNSPLRGLEPLARAYVAFALLFVSVSHFTFGPWLLRPTRDSDEPHAVLQENVSATGCGDRRSDTVWSDAAGASDARCSLERGVGRQESSVQEALPEREFHTGAGGGGRRQGARDRRQGDATSSKRGFWRALWRGAVGAVRSEEKDR